MNKEILILMKQISILNKKLDAIINYLGINFDNKTSKNKEKAGKNNGNK